MASQVDTTTINTQFPVTGVQNDTKGFRDNFAAINQNFSYVKSEIEDLQSKGVFKEALNDSALNNDMSASGSTLIAAKLKGASTVVVDHDETAGALNIDFKSGTYHKISSSNDINIEFSNWPSTGFAGAIRIEFNITDVEHTITLPTSVTETSTLIRSVNNVSAGLYGYTLRFPMIGSYVMDFLSSDSGVNVTVIDVSGTMSYPSIDALALMPRYDATQAENNTMIHQLGSVIFNTTINKMQVYDGSGWVSLW